MSTNEERRERAQKYHAAIAALFALEQTYPYDDRTRHEVYRVRYTLGNLGAQIIEPETDRG